MLQSAEILNKKYQKDISGDNFLYVGFRSEPSVPAQADYNEPDQQQIIVIWSHPRDPCESADNTENSDKKS